MLKLQQNTVLRLKICLLLTQLVWTIVIRLNIHKEWRPTKQLVATHRFSIENLDYLDILHIIAARCQTRSWNVRSIYIVYSINNKVAYSNRRLRMLQTLKSTFLHHPYYRDVNYCYGACLTLISPVTLGEIARTRHMIFSVFILFLLFHFLSVMHTWN